VSARLEAVAGSAHSLKGMLGTLAAHGIDEIARDLEIMNSEENLINAREKMEELREGTAKLSGGLEAEFGSEASAGSGS